MFNSEINIVRARIVLRTTRLCEGLNRRGTETPATSRSFMKVVDSTERISTKAPTVRTDIPYVQGAFSSQQNESVRATTRACDRNGFSGVPRTPAPSDVSKQATNSEP